jgi:hypothetical protein
MRLFELTDQVPTRDNLEAFIEKNCVPFLKQNPNYENLPLYRGINVDKDIMISPGSMVDRKPKDTPVPIHKAFVTAFKQAGIHANRSNSIFCTGDSFQASQYGVIYEVYPIGNFIFSWSPKVFDLFSPDMWETLFNTGMLKIHNLDDFMDGISNIGYIYSHYTDDQSFKSLRWLQIPAEVRQKYLGQALMDIKLMKSGNLDHLDVSSTPKFVEWIKTNYDTNNFVKAINAGQEIMVQCDKMLLVKSLAMN